METMSDVLLEIQPFQEAFPTLAKVFHISFTISVNSSHCERSFAALKRIKSFLRSNMIENWLVDLASLSIERNHSGSILLEEVTKKFLATEHRKIILQLIYKFIISIITIMYNHIYHCLIDHSFMKHFQILNSTRIYPCHNDFTKLATQLLSAKAACVFMVSQTAAEIQPKLKDWIRPKGNDLSEDAALQLETLLTKKVSR